MSDALKKLVDIAEPELNPDNISPEGKLVIRALLKSMQDIDHSLKELTTALNGEIARQSSRILALEERCSELEAREVELDELKHKVGTIWSVIKFIAASIGATLLAALLTTIIKK